ncbi:MAG: insulinase family protein [Elusimicrobia bacterium]|nr:insulinase family protein [Elusimicrobiota bacterium]
MGLFLILWLGVPHFLCGSGDNPIQALEKRVVEHTLRNGMKALILERRSAPLVSFEMMYRAGGVDEISGRTGLAHLFEHMMFKGSKTVGTKDYAKEKPLLDQIEMIAQETRTEEGKGKSGDQKKIQDLKSQMEKLQKEAAQWAVPEEFDEIYQKEGAEGLNAFTGKDMTGFVVSLPSNKWELWPILESDRMRNPVLRDFYKERDVVMEERRMRYEDSPQGVLWENFISAAYRAHPYSFPTIGWSSDIQKLTGQDAEEFFKSHYAPNNAVVAIVGDVDANQVIERLERYFAEIPPQPQPPQFITQEPSQAGERRLTVQFESEPSLLLGFHKPNPPDREDLVMLVIARILSGGRSSRFQKKIVQKGIAVSAWASNGEPGERYPNLIVFGGSPRKPHVNEDLESAIEEELEKLKSEPVSEKELKKIQNGLESEMIHEIESNKGIASGLAYYQTVLGDWRYPLKILEQIPTVTPQEIQQAAKKYFITGNRIVAFLERELQ